MWYSTGMSRYVFIILFIIGLVITVIPIKTYESFGFETPVYCENGKDNFNGQIGYPRNCEDGEIIGFIARDGVKEFPEQLALKAFGFLLAIFTPIAYVVISISKRHHAVVKTTKRFPKDELDHKDI
jgi:uncharacterized membrane protein